MDLLKMTPHKKCTVLKYIYENLTYYKLVENQKFQTPLNNYQGHGVYGTTLPDNKNPSCAV